MQSKQKYRTNPSATRPESEIDIKKHWSKEVVPNRKGPFAAEVSPATTAVEMKRTKSRRPAIAMRPATTSKNSPPLLMRHRDGWPRGNGAREAVGSRTTTAAAVAVSRTTCAPRRLGWWCLQALDSLQLELIRVAGRSGGAARVAWSARRQSRGQPRDSTRTRFYLAHV